MPYFFSLSLSLLYIKLLEQTYKIFKILYGIKCILHGVKVYGYTFKESNSVIHICFLSKVEFTLKEKNLLLFEQILSFKSKPEFGRAMSARKANRKSRKLFPLENITEKNMAVYPYTLRQAQQNYTFGYG